MLLLKRTTKEAKLSICPDRHLQDKLSVWGSFKLTKNKRNWALADVLLLLPMRSSLSVYALGAPNKCRDTNEMSLGLMGILMKPLPVYHQEAGRKQKSTLTGLSSQIPSSL